MKASRQGGFTILELLVVLVIIGIIVSMVTLSVGGSETRALRDEATRLSALIDLAAQQAVLNGSELALQVEEDGYQFLGFDGEKWLPLEDGGPLRPRQLPPLITLKAEVEGQENEEKLFGENEAVQVWILSSGEMSPFSITLRLENGPAYQVAGDLLGRMRVTGPQES